MNLLSDVITYIRRIIKSPSDADITDNLIIDYINRFWIMDVDARMQLFDLKTKYSFQTTPGVDKYNMPLYNIQTQPGSQQIASYPVYQGFLGPAYVNGVPVAFVTQKQSFFNSFPNVTQYNQAVAVGNGSSGPYQLQVPFLGANLPNPNNPPFNGMLRGHVDITGIIAQNNAVVVDPPLADSTSFPAILGNIPTTSIDPGVYITSIAQNGGNAIITDSGVFEQSNENLGFLIEPGNAPFGNATLPNGYVNTFTITGVSQATQAVVTATTNFVAGQIVEIQGVVGMTELNGNSYTVVSVTPTTVTLNVDSTGFTAYTSGGGISSFNNVINYLTGTATNVFFSSNIPEGNNINVQCYFFQSGLPRAILFYNNTLTLRVPPAMQYLVELDAYLSPAAFLQTSGALPFGYMAEYIARGAARKILSDTGDVEQFQFYEPLFREQENLVWKRSQRQWTATRTETIYSRGSNNGQGGFSNNGGTAF